MESKRGKEASQRSCITMSEVSVGSRVVNGCSAGVSNSWSFKLSSGSTTKTREMTLDRDVSIPHSRPSALLEQLKDNATKLLGRKWQKRQVRWDDQEWNMLECHSKAYDTQSLMVSCGTVTLDKAEDPDRRVLLIWNKNTRAVSSPQDDPAPPGDEHIRIGDRCYTRLLSNG